MIRLLIVVCGLFLMAPSCTASSTAPSPDGFEDCTAGGLASFSVAMRDSASGQPVSPSATLTWSAGVSSGKSIGQIGSFGASSPDELAGPFGRPGIFDVTLQAKGYRDWRRNGVAVVQGATHCSIQNSVRLVAKLQPN
jgi:hypothetical protein